MNLKLKLANPRLVRDSLQSSRFSRAQLQRVAHQICIDLPRGLFSARLSSRSASFIMLLCLPALALFLGMTLPPIIFPTAENEAYFYFALSFSQDLSSGYILALAALCMILAPALPAASADSHQAI